MQLIIVNGQVIAKHADEQDVSSSYPDAEVVVSDARVEIGDPDPRPKMGTEQTLKSLRQQRDRLLRDSDWTQVLDAPLSVRMRDKWKVYRQSLRDLPATVGGKKLGEVVWPRRPK